MPKPRFQTGKVTTSYDGCGGALLRERKGAFHCINFFSRSFWIRRPPLRFSAGPPGEKTRGLWDCGIVAKSRFLKFLDFSCFSLFEKMRKLRISKAPPLIFPRFPAAQILGWGAGGKTRGLWDCGEIAISEISGFFMFFLI